MSRRWSRRAVVPVGRIDQGQEPVAEKVGVVVQTVNNDLNSKIRNGNSEPPVITNSRGQRRAVAAGGESRRRYFQAPPVVVGDPPPFAGLLAGVRGVELRRVADLYLQLDRIEEVTGKSMELERRLLALGRVVDAQARVWWEQARGVDLGIDERGS